MIRPAHGAALVVLLLLQALAKDPDDVPFKDSRIAKFENPVFSSGDAPWVSADLKTWAARMSKGEGSCLVVNGREGDEWASIQDWAVLKDGAEAAYVARDKKQRTYLVFGGRKGKPYDSIQALLVSPNREHAVAIAKLGEKEILLFDEEEGHEFDNVEPQFFTGASQYVAIGYKERKNGKTLKSVVVNTTKGEDFDDIEQLRLTPDGTRVAFVATKADRKYAVIRGETSEAFDDVLFATGSPDGKSVAFLSTVDGKTSIRVEGKPSEPLVGDSIRDLAYGATGSVAYSAARNGKRFAILDGVVGPAWDDVTGFAFSPDGKRFAYAARDGEFWRAVVDGTAGDESERISEIGFSPNSASVTWKEQDGRATFIIINGVKHSTHEMLRSITWAPDGLRFALVSWSDDGYFVTIDGKAGPAGRDEPKPVFSADGLHVVYALRTKENSYVVVDGEQGDPHASIDEFAISPDGKHVACIANDNGKASVFLDGKSQGAWDSASGLVFSRKGKLAFQVSLGLEEGHCVVIDRKEIRCATTAANTIDFNDRKITEKYAYIFRTLHWSDDETQVAFLAEVHIPYWKQNKGDKGKYVQYHSELWWKTAKAKK